MKYIVYAISVLVISIILAYGIKYIIDRGDKDITIVKGFEELEQEYGESLTQENNIDQNDLDAKVWLIKGDKKNTVIIKYETYIKNVKKKINKRKMIIELENTGEEIEGQIWGPRFLYIKIETKKEIDKVIIKEKEIDKENEDKKG